MRVKLTQPFEKGRVKDGQFGSDSSWGPTGQFWIKSPVSQAQLCIIASNGYDWQFDSPPWEHVSVSTSKRCPTWEEMSFVRLAFWEDHETVMQLHVPRTKHIDMHPYCLHLWRPIGIEIPMPPEGCV